MYEFLTLINGQYAIYDTIAHSLELYTPTRLDKFLIGHDVGGIATKTGFVKEIVTDTPYTLTRDLGAIAYIDYLELPTFIIREKIKLPKIPIVCNMYYKGLCVTIRDSKVDLTHHIYSVYNAKGKILNIAPNYNENISNIQMNGCKIQTIEEYVILIKEFLSCLTYDNAILMYNISVDLDTTYLDLTKFEKSYKISRYNIQPVYMMPLASAKYQRIKYNGIMLKGYDYVDGKVERTVNFIDCTEFKVTDWNKAGVRLGLEDFIKLKMIPNGLLVFKRSAPLVKTIQKVLETNDNLKVINLGNFKTLDNIDTTVQQIRIQQGKYVLVGNTDTRKVVLLANIT